MKSDDSKNPLKTTDKNDVFVMVPATVTVILILSFMLGLGRTVQMMISRSVRELSLLESIIVTGGVGALCRAVVLYLLWRDNLVEVPME